MSIREDFIKNVCNSDLATNFNYEINDNIGDRLRVWVEGGTIHIEGSGIDRDGNHTTYTYTIGGKNAVKLVNKFRHEFGTERTLEDIIESEFDFSNGIGALESYSRKSRVELEFDYI